MATENKNAGEVIVKFTCPAFRYEGVEYKSAEVERAAEAGNQAAQAIVARLVEMGSGIVEVTEEETGDKVDPHVLQRIAEKILALAAEQKKIDEDAAKVVVMTVVKEEGGSNE